MSIATFAAGCFWGVEAEFRRVEGVLSTEVGYTGGETEGPTYQAVCAGRTGHAEAVRVEYDPDRVSYDELLATFFRLHDPTQLDRQGPDVGTQYRSAIFFHDEAQEQAARAAKQAEDASGRHAGPVVTEIATAGAWWKAEEYHQQYLAKRGQDQCAATIRRG